SMNHRVQSFSQIGEFQSGFGRQGADDGDLEMPWGICIDRNDDIYVADWGNNRVQKFSPSGKLLLKFEESSNNVGSLKGPSGVAVDSDGDVYVTDWGNHRVQIYDAGGQYITALVGDAQEPSPWHKTYLDGNPEYLKARRRADMEQEWRFRRPVAVNVDAEDRIVVLESARHRLQIYNKLKDYEEHSLNL
ncbi:MAG: NHL repeat-containing protein, partial [Chloroflexota bacterium]|nr:NHL repeat-containing protein [Chloroflexota bacterium]